MDAINLMRQELKAPANSSEQYNTTQVEQQSKQAEIASKLGHELWLKSGFTQEVLSVLTAKKEEYHSRAIELACKADPTNDNLIRSLLQQEGNINSTIWLINKH